MGNSSLNLIYRNDYDFPIRVDASAQDGALYISMWREDDLREELAIRSRFTPAAREKTPPASEEAGGV